MKSHVVARRAGARALAATGAVAIGLMLGGSAAHAAPIAHAAKTIDVTETASLKLVRKSGSTLYESGTATGTLPGNVSARFEVSVLKVTGTVTIYPRSGGSLKINVLGYPKSTGTVARFGGTMTIAGGSGKYAGARGSGSFSGTVNRRSWAATVTATGKLTY